jgi:hypothetical protein
MLAGGNRESGRNRSIAAFISGWVDLLRREAMLSPASEPDGSVAVHPANVSTRRKTVTDRRASCMRNLTVLIWVGNGTEKARKRPG